ncbi:hypothetical protein HHI36_015904 [Cryptolaemus montrouzieri]|uniref:Uncharacterized protein n=1 Tax=Cryptolaemus montrouzieri TaxID=559131 RepID=A0ABD2N725_9CUCU
MQAQVVCLGRVQQLKFSVPKIVVAFLDSKAVHLDKIQCLEILISVFDTAAPPNTNNLPTTSHSVVESGGKTNGSKRSSGSLHIDDPSNAEVIKLIETKFTKLESENVDDLRTKFDTLLRDNQKLKKENEALKVRMNRMESDMEPMKTEMDKEDIVQESCNLVLVGLKDSQDNGVGVQKVVQTTDPETTSNDYVIEVLPSKAPRKPILLKFKNAETCKRVFSSYKAGVRKLTTTSCEIDEENTALYLYEDLPKNVRLLLKQAK